MTLPLALVKPQARRELGAPGYTSTTPRLAFGDHAHFEAYRHRDGNLYMTVLVDYTLVASICLTSDAAEASIREALASVPEVETPETCRKCLATDDPNPSPAVDGELCAGHREALDAIGGAR